MTGQPALVLVLLCLAFGVSTNRASAQSACIAAVERLTATMHSPGEIRQKATELQQERERENDRVRRALLGCQSAELFKRIGDARAEQLYKAIIQEEPSGEYFLLFGDYLRNYRGPGQPLVYRAAAQYVEGLRQGDTGVENLIRRSLLALYERDGLLLAGSMRAGRPMLFFSSQWTGGRTVDDLSGVDTLRVLSSGAMYALSAYPSQRSVIEHSLGDFIRDVWRGRTYQRLRLRSGPVAVDGYFEGLGSAGSQVYRFDQPDSRGNVSLTFGGAGLEYVNSLASLFDVSIRADVKFGTRQGLIEFEPNQTESVRSTGAKAMISRFVGPDKIGAEFSAGHDGVTQNVAEPNRIARDQTTWGVTGRYQVYRPIGASRPYERPIAARGSEIFAGTARATEAFGTIGVVRDDLFFGGSLKGFPGGGLHSFDVTVQPTLFRYHRESRAEPAADIDPLESRHLETFFTVLYRIIDHENERNINVLPHLLFLNVVGLASIGQPQVGLDAFARRRVGAQLDAKLVGFKRGGMTWLTSVRYELQRFSRLDERTHVFNGTLNLGF